MYMLFLILAHWFVRREIQSVTFVQCTMMFVLDIGVLETDLQFHGRKLEFEEERNKRKRKLASFEAIGARGSQAPG